MSRTAIIAVLALLAVYVALGARYVPIWTSDQTLWPYAASVTPNHVIPVLNAEIVRRR